MIRKLLALAILLAGLCLAASAFFAWRYQTPELPDDPVAVIVLSAGAVNGQMDAQTQARTARGVAIWKTLPEDTLLILSGGGNLDRNEPIKAELMAAAARDAGVPEANLRIEDGSGSTLQNALFSAAILGEDVGRPVIFVTNRFHGLRSLASLQWAGFDDLTFVPTEEDGAAPELNGLGMEAIKWPLNVARGGLFWIATTAGADPEPLVPYLR